MRFHALLRGALLAGCVSIAVRPAAAQSGDPKTTAGVWRATERIEGAPVAAKKSLVAQLDAVAPLFRAVPSLNPPVGFTVAPKLVLTGRDGATKMERGTFLIYLIAHSRRPDGTINTSGVGEGLTAAVSANNLDCVLGQENSAHLDDRTGSLYTPPVTRTFRGFVTYNDCVFITKRTVPPFLPASRERVMKIIVEQFHELPELARALQGRLDAMSAAERAAPAFFNEKEYVSLGIERKLGGPLFGLAGQKDQNDMALQELVQPNPAFFDTSRPGDMQVVTYVSACSIRYTRQSQWCAGFGDQFDKIDGSFDLHALAALVR